MMPRSGQGSSGLDPSAAFEEGLDKTGLEGRSPHAHARRDAR